MTVSAFGLRIAVAITLLGVASCSGGSREATWQKPDLVNTPTFTSESKLPFESYQLSRNELESMQSGHAKLLQACAARYGVDVKFYGDYIRPADPATTLWGGPLGTLNAKHAASLGYHAGPRDPYVGGPGFYLSDPMNIGPIDDGSEVAAVIYGVEVDGSAADKSISSLPSGGCMRIVEDAIAVKAVSPVDLTVELMNLAYNDTRMKDASARWSSCMKSAGYEFQRVDQASESIAAASLSVAEIKLATSDVRCTESSDWRDTYYAILGDYQDQAIARDAETFRSGLKAQRDRLQRIEKLLAAGPSASPPVS